MLKKMTCCLMACVGLSAFGAEWILNMNPSGNTEILLGEEKIGEIRAVVFRPEWQAKQFTVIADKAKEPGKVFARSGHDGAAALDLTMAYKQTAPNAVSFQYSFKPQGDMQANSINAQVVLATEFTAGRAYETENEKGVFPVSHGGIHLLRTKASQLTADTKFGKIGLKSLLGGGSASDSGGLGSLLTGLIGNAVTVDQLKLSFAYLLTLFLFGLAIFVCIAAIMEKSYEK